MAAEGRDERAVDLTVAAGGEASGVREAGGEAARPASSPAPAAAPAAAPVRSTPRRLSFVRRYSCCSGMLIRAASCSGMPTRGVSMGRNVPPADSSHAAVSNTTRPHGDTG